MVNERNYDTFMKDLEVCVKKKEDESRQIDRLNNTDVNGLSKPDRAMDQELDRFRNNSNDMQKRLDKSQDFANDMKANHVKVYEPLPPESPVRMQTNYTKRYDPKINASRLVKLREDAEFDVKYKELFIK